MHGLVNKAIEQMAIAAGGPECWSAICKRAGHDELSFLSLEAYPDQMTYDLVEAASEVMQLPPDTILEKFGEYWVRFTVDQGYGAMMEAAGNDMFTFLNSLDRMHGMVGHTMPNLEPPSFRVEKLAEDVLQIDYFSDREGLAPMVIGLLRGLADRFEISVDVEQLPTEMTAQEAKASYRVYVKEPVDAA